MNQVLITGASSDIGLALCRKYLSEGWSIIGQYRTERTEFDALVGSNLKTWKCDFANTNKLNKDLENNIHNVSNSNSFINLAAEMSPLRFSEASSCDILNTLSVNLIPGLLIMKTLGPEMIKNKFGRIVHGSSIGVKFGGGQQNFTYSLSKHTQEFIPQECRNWAKENVYVNIARIGVTKTRIHSKLKNKDLSSRVSQIPVGRLATPEEIAEALFWLGSEKNGFTTNETISIAGGE